MHLCEIHYLNNRKLINEHLEYKEKNIVPHIPVCSSLNGMECHTNLVRSIDAFRSYSMW